MAKVWVQVKGSREVAPRRELLTFMNAQNGLTRENIVRRDLTEEQAINLIENRYRAHFDPNCNFDAWDQLLICESLDESTPVRERPEPGQLNEQENVINKEANGNDPFVNGGGNGTRKHPINFELTQSKLDAISALKSCGYRTKRSLVAKLLDQTFGDPSTYPTHWPYIAEQYTPKSINSALAETINKTRSGLASPSRYFTSVLTRYHPKRKIPKRKEYLSLVKSGKNLQPGNRQIDKEGNQ